MTSKATKQHRKKLYAESDKIKRPPISKEEWARQLDMCAKGSDRTIIESDDIEDKLDSMIEEMEETIETCANNAGIKLNEIKSKANA